MDRGPELRATVDPPGEPSDNEIPKVGTRLLNKFESQWRNLHSFSERNITKVRAVLTKIDLLERSTSARLKAINNFINSFEALPKLEDLMTRIQHDVDVLEDSFKQIEDSLLYLKNHKEQVDCDRSIQTMRERYEWQAQDLRNQSEERRAKLNSEHLQRLAAHEINQQNQLEERRVMLERAFQEEKSRYLERDVR